MFPVRKGKGFRLPNTWSFCEEVGSSLSPQMRRHLQPFIDKGKVKIVKGNDNAWRVKTLDSGREIRVTPNMGYWLVTYNKEGELKEFGILKYGGKEIRRYNICDYNGRIIAPLESRNREN